jgi:cobalt-zinc-cadmium resistance protein CzcA
MRPPGGSLLDLGQQSLAIRGSGLIQTNEDLENIVLDSQRGVPIFVRDIGRVRIGSLPQTGILGVNHQRSPSGGVEGIVLMRRWENPSQVLKAIHAAVDEINATRLPRASGWSRSTIAPSWCRARSGPSRECSSKAS